MYEIFFYSYEVVALNCPVTSVDDVFRHLITEPTFHICLITYFQLIFEYGKFHSLMLLEEANILFKDTITYRRIRLHYIHIR